MSKGRKRISIDALQFWQLYSKWLSGEISQKDICNELKISRATLGRRLNEFRRQKQDETTILSQIFKTTTKYKLNQVNVSNGLSLMENINDSTIKVVFFDPQYREVLNRLSYGNEGARQNKRIALPQMNKDTIYTFMEEIDRVLKPEAYCFLWVDKYIMGEGIRFYNNTNLKPVDLLVWDKQRIGMGSRLRNQAEFLIVLQKPPVIAKKTWQDHAIPDVWSEKVKHNWHPHTKPIGLVTKLVLTTSQPGDVILDPAAGSYVTLQAVSDLGDRYFLGCDLINPLAPAPSQKEIGGNNNM